MKPLKTAGLSMLAVFLVCALCSLAAAQMFKTPKQFVNIGIVAEDGTILPTDVWTLKQPDLTSLNFAIPKKKYVAFNSISMRFVLPPNTPPGSYRLIFADKIADSNLVYYAISLTNFLSGDSTTLIHAYANADFNPCLLFSKMPAMYVIKVTNAAQPNSGAPAEGILRVGLLGYTAP
jgi:hypothetical protein